MTRGERFRTWFFIGAWFATSVLMYGYHYNRADCDFYIVRSLKDGCRNVNSLYWALAWPIQVPLNFIGDIAVAITKPKTEPTP